MRPALAPAMVIEEMESGWGSCLRTWGEMESRIMFEKSSKSIHLRIHPEGDGVNACHPQEGRRHAPVQSGHPLFPGNQPLKKFMPGLIFLPHAVEQAVKGSLVGSSWRGLDPNFHCVQRIASQHSSCSWEKNHVDLSFLQIMNWIESYLPYNLPKTQEPLLLLVVGLVCYWLLASFLQGLVWFLLFSEYSAWLGLRSFRPLVFPIWHHVTTGPKNTHWR